MQKITPFLWFDNNAEDAMAFYVGIFPDSKIGDVSRYGENGPAPAGTVITASFRLLNQEFMVLNGGPLFHFNEAVSFFVNCDSQEEVDSLWSALTADGGEESQCGWLKDKYGLSWQIVPSMLGSVLAGPDAEGAGRAMAAMLKMRKLTIADLQNAYDHE